MKLSGVMAAHAMPTPWLSVRPTKLGQKLLRTRPAAPSRTCTLPLMPSDRNENLLYNLILGFRGTPSILISSTSFQSLWLPYSESMALVGAPSALFRSSRGAAAPTDASFAP